MQNRHRIPTIFNLSMVDVLCCALGCVILLWLVYFKEAKERATAAGKSKQELSVAHLQIKKITGQLSNFQAALAESEARVNYLSSQFADATAQRDQLASKLDRTNKDWRTTLDYLKIAQGRVGDLQGAVDRLEKVQASAGLQMAIQMREYNRVNNQLLAAMQMIRDLEKQNDSQRAQLGSLGNQSEDLRTQLKLAQALVARLESQAREMQSTSKTTSDKLGQAESRAVSLQADLDRAKSELRDGSRRMDDLLALKQLLEQSLKLARDDLAKAQKDLAETKLLNHGLAGEATVLSSKLAELRLAADNRFAGIEMVGQRVVFMIDMSGSMGMTSALKEDPDKWPLLCEILGKLMQSLPSMTHYQVILFSKDVRYPIGEPGKWIEYKGLESVKQTVKAVLAVKPYDGTNMSTAFEETIRYRDIGLDTIYMLSDGLPNMGAGMPAGAERMSEAEKGVHLGKYIRDRLLTTWNEPRGRWLKTRVRINAVGFYYDSPDVGAFLWALARENDGGFVGLSKP